ncbi:hypothetical protein BMS3Abin02_01759 [bacterium BMS3Abin02]|nr:hypothetical protein BMS3Abin02_01759 [bacterium BMS3Abin02]GBE22518.1 hypothetical protein BMS3Bbin01_01893 [bacterium BMS3Bbin01]HDH26239.1 hypothetical protein [Actinomycetota bacterium]HDK45119.1 hypothetical protein [Actinomycetota bacterium]HDL50104.1 hypothetical protein [Actinomycetota bacterium]
MRRLWRLLLAGSLIAAVLLLPATANAAISGGCTGSAVIDGITYGPDNDTPDNPIVVPIDKDGVVATWEGSVSFLNTNHHGNLDIVVGPWTIKIADWGHPNSGDKRSANGTYSLDEFKAQFPVPVSLIPRGIYEVSGFHQADGGRCDGHVMVKIDGSPLSNPLGIAVVAGTFLTGLALLGAAFKGKTR